MPEKFKKFELLALLVIILTASFFRFWQIRDYVVFLGDEGRDMIIMRNIFIEKNLPFLGPTASVGGFYLGPIYYWMAAPFLLFWHFDPIGPSVMVAIFGVLTVFLLFKFLKDSLGYLPAAMAAILFATAPLIVRYSRSSWNPNPLPFFALLLVFSTYLGITKNKFWYFLLAGAAFGVAIQLHYLALVLGPIVAAILFLSVRPQKALAWTVQIILGALITFSPFLIFEIKHNFPNFRTILEFTTRGTTVGVKSSNIIWSTTNIGNIFLEYLSGVQSTIYTKIAFFTLTLSGIFGIWTFRKDFEKRLIFTIAVVWFLGGLILLRAYKGQLYDYYFGSIFPAPFLLFGCFAYLFFQQKFLKFIPYIATLIILTIFFSNAFYKTEPNKLIDQTANIADFIIEKTDKSPYNFALVSESNSDHAYRYFLEIKNHKPTQLEELITDQLIILCESKDCSPLGNPLWEVAGFGRGEIKEEYYLEKYNFKVYKLIHWPGEPSPAGKPASKGI